MTETDDMLPKIIGSGCELGCAVLFVVSSIAGVLVLVESMMRMVGG
jgi:hypothetical protein